ncbi:MAG: tetratricopeptide repeat protein, partial [Candidatus Cloacimonetes bacterium]|nr:tetratricopeptide repeat protein [Candidatus Cloacimonadota bacterium]
MKKIHIIIISLILILSSELLPIDSVFVNNVILGKIPEEYTSSDSLLKAIEYFNENLDKNPGYYLKAAGNLLKKVEKEDHNYLAYRTILTITDIFLLTARYDSVDVYLKKLEPFTKTNNKSILADYYIRKGKYHESTGDFAIALEFYLHSLDKSEDNSENLARTYYNIGNLYYKWNDLDKSQEYFEKILIVADSSSVSYARALMNIGTVYLARKDLDKAVVKFEDALERLQKLNLESQVVIVYNNLASIYLQRAQFDKAIEILEKAAEVNKKIGRIGSLIKNYANISIIYTTSNNQKELAKYITKIESLIDQITDPSLLISVNEIRRFYYANVGDFQNAYQILARTSELKDSTFTRETRKTIASLESNFQLEKKNIEIEVLKKDNQIKNMEIKRERMLTTVLLLGLIILSISLYLIISLKRKRDKL